MTPPEVAVSPTGRSFYWQAAALVNAPADSANQFIPLRSCVLGQAFGPRRSVARLSSRAPAWK